MKSNCPKQIIEVTKIRRKKFHYGPVWYIDILKFLSFKILGDIYLPHPHMLDMTDNRYQKKRNN